ncbi:hypothetical protein AB4Y33_43220, partial [Paraburkholderia sp. BR14319]|uniref:hypothetical protein n=1 Tax=Paraburkholderia sp. BR14319 TaxID=3237005 RepID=UPI0034D17B36
MKKILLEPLTGRAAALVRLRGRNAGRIGRPVSETVTSVDNGGAFLVMRVNGVPFESVSRGEIEARYD